MSNVVTYEALVKLGKEQCVADITKEEYANFVEGKMWSCARALTLIKNSRKRKESDANKKFEVHIGYPLGGRDFVYKGITVEKAKSQLIPLLMKDGSILELTQFGSFKGKHLYKSEFDVNVTEKQGAERIYINHNIDSVRVLDEKLDIKQLVTKAVRIGDMNLDMRYQYVIFIGEVTNFDLESKFEDGEKVGSYPLIWEEQPVFQMVCKEYKRYVRIVCSPCNNAEHILDIPDLMEVLKVNDIKQISDAYAGEWVVAVGFVRKADYSENGGEFFTIEATTIMMLPEALRDTYTRVTQVLDEGPVHAMDLDVDKDPKPFDNGLPLHVEKKTPTYDIESANKQIADLKQKIKEGKEILGDDFSIQGLRDLGLVPASIPDVIVEKLLKDA